MMCVCSQRIVAATEDEIQYRIKRQIEKNAAKREGKGRNERKYPIENNV